MYNYQVRYPECGCQEWAPTDSREFDYHYAGQLAEVECDHCWHTFTTPSMDMVLLWMLALFRAYGLM